MNVSLSNDLRNFVRKKVESGDFPSFVIGPVFAM